MLGKDVQLVEMRVAADGGGEREAHRHTPGTGRDPEATRLEPRLEVIPRRQHAGEDLGETERRKERGRPALDLRQRGEVRIPGAADRVAISHGGHPRRGVAPSPPAPVRFLRAAFPLSPSMV
jgi:hypothetical protein